MKKKILLILLFVLCIQIFAETYKTDFVHMHYEDCFFFYSENGKIHFLNKYVNTDIDLTSSIKGTIMDFMNLNGTSTAFIRSQRRAKNTILFLEVTISFS